MSCWGTHEELDAQLLPLDVTQAGQLEALFAGVSPGPLRTRAASGLKDVDHLLADPGAHSPLGDTVDIEDVGSTCAYLASDYARRLTGSTVYVDGGLNIVA